MSASYNSNKGFQGDDFQSGCSVCKKMDLNEYYGNSQKGGVPKKPAKKSASTKKPAKKPAKKSASTKKPAKKPAKKRGGSDAFDEIDKINSSITWATQAGGTELASEYYTSAQQGSYAPYNASKNEKCGGGRKKRVVRGGGNGFIDQYNMPTQNMDNAMGHMGRSMADANKATMGGGRKKRVVRGGGDMDDYEAKREQSQGNMNGSMASADSATKGGGCGCGYKPKTSGRKRGGSDGYYADTVTGDDPVIETEDVSDDGKLNGGAKKKQSSSKGTKKTTKQRSSSSKGAKKTTTKKQKGGISDYSLTNGSWGPINTTSVTDKAYFEIFNKSTPYMSKKELVECGVAPELTGCIPPSDAYPRPSNYDDFIGGTKKRKPAKKSTSSKTKAKKH
jgi:hypothetical protein